MTMKDRLLRRTAPCMFLRKIFKNKGLSWYIRCKILKISELHVKLLIIKEIFLYFAEVFFFLPFRAISSLANGEG